MSEDCLYLNIFAPLSARPGSNKAVMVYIHGGYFEKYSSNNGNTTSGEEKAKTGDVIVVTINYRLGPFGFLHTGNSRQDIRGNLGIKDQARALKWVKNNIYQFGGSSTNITLFGHSVGAMSVLVHLSSRRTSSLFQRTILMSPPLGLPFRTQSAAVVQGQQFVTKLQCNNTNIKTCMKAKTAQEIVNAMTITEYAHPAVLLSQGKFWDFLMPWKPYVDGYSVPSELVEAASKGLYNSKDLIIGTTTQEALPITYLLTPNIMNLTDLQGYVAAWHGVENVPNILAQYLGPDTNIDHRTTVGYMMTDYVYTCPVRYLARILAKHNSRYMYVFDQKEPAIVKVPSFPPSCYSVACHSVDRSYLFNMYAEMGFNVTEDETRLTEDLQDYWTSFARQGRPNSNCPPEWPRYCSRDPETVQFRAGDTEIIENYRGDICDMWDKINFARK